MLNMKGEVCIFLDGWL